MYFCMTSLDQSCQTHDTSNTRITFHVTFIRQIYTWPPSSTTTCTKTLPSASCCKRVNSVQLQPSDMTLLSPSTVVATNLIAEMGFSRRDAMYLNHHSNVVAGMSVSTLVQMWGGRWSSSPVAAFMKRTRDIVEEPRQWNSEIQFGFCPCCVFCLSQDGDFSYHTLISSFDFNFKEN